MNFLVTDLAIICFTTVHFMIIAHEIAHSWTGNLVSKYWGHTNVMTSVGGFIAFI